MGLPSIITPSGLFSALPPVIPGFPGLSKALRALGPVFWDRCVSLWHGRPVPGPVLGIVSAKNSGCRPREVTRWSTVTPRPWCSPCSRRCSPRSSPTGPPRRSSQLSPIFDQDDENRLACRRDTVPERSFCAADRLHARHLFSDCRRVGSLRTASVLLLRSWLSCSPGRQEAE